MTGITHLTVGATAGLLLSEKLNINPLIAVAVCGFASIVVDIDEEHSMVNKLLRASPKHKNLLKIILGVLLIGSKRMLGFNPVPDAMLFYLGIILVLSAICSHVEYRFSFSRGLQKRKYHRTLFHHPLVGFLLLLMPLTTISVPETVKTCYQCGIASHYLLDSFNPNGLPGFPLKKRIRMPITFKSGNIIAETGIVVFCGALIATQYEPVVRLADVFRNLFH